MKLIATQYRAKGTGHEYQFNRSRRDESKFTVQRWPLGEPMNPPRAEVLVDGRWMPLLTAPTAHDLITEDQMVTVVTYGDTVDRPSFL